MGNIIALQLGPIDLNLFKPEPPPPEPFPWIFFIASILILGIIVSVLILFCILVLRNKRARVIPIIPLCLLLLLTIPTPIEGKIRGKYIVNRVRKPITKGIGSILGTTAIYLGLDKLASALEYETETAIPILAIVGFLSILFIFLVLRVLFSIYKYIKPNNGSNAHPPIELNEISSTVRELLNRSNPPPIRN